MKSFEIVLRTDAICMLRARYRHLLCSILTVGTFLGVGLYKLAYRPYDVSETVAHIDWMLRRYNNNSIVKFTPEYKVVYKQVHQSWKNFTLPPRFQRWSKSWQPGQCLPGQWSYKLWTDDDNEEFIRRNYPFFLHTYNSLPRKIEQVDAVRYLYLHRHGGVYTDLDNECLKSFEHLLHTCPVALAAMRRKDGHDDYIQNSFMYSRPGHPFWLRILRELVLRSAQYWNYELEEEITGPQLLMHVLQQCQREGNWEICVFPSRLFNPFSWYIKHTHCRDLNKMNNDDLQKCKANFSKAFVIQYHTNIWRSGNIL